MRMTDSGAATDPAASAVVSQGRRRRLRSSTREILLHRASLFVLMALLLLMPSCCSAAAAAAGDPTAVVRCRTAWGGIRGDDEQLVPPERVDDGYCDCPETGDDEPGTGACAGAGDWAGVDGRRRDA